MTLQVTLSPHFDFRIQLLLHVNLPALCERHLEPLSLFHSAKRENKREGREDRKRSISTADRVILTHCPRQAEVAKLNIVAKEKAKKAARVESALVSARYAN